MPILFGLLIVVLLVEKVVLATVSEKVNTNSKMNRGLLIHSPLP